MFSPTIWAAAHVQTQLAGLPADVITPQCGVADSLKPTFKLLAGEIFGTSVTVGKILIVIAFAIGIPLAFSKKIPVLLKGIGISLLMIVVATALAANTNLLPGAGC
ncbi:hypothetical protein IPM09_03045 [Candidatus Saccharibacteria bacterium]|nr:MAG: hypothetical protein IPM09_03045 [Candidatus Saccharibacteria bacterium]